MRLGVMDGWEALEYFWRENLRSNFLQLLAGWACCSSDQRCSLLGLTWTKCCLWCLWCLWWLLLLCRNCTVAGSTVAPGTGVDSCALLVKYFHPSKCSTRLRRVTSAGLAFLLLFYTWLSTKLLRRSRRDRFVVVALCNPAPTKSLW